MKILGIIQARMNSTRLPGKALLKLGNLTVIDWVFNRVSKSNLLDDVVVAITNNKNDDQLEKHLLSRKISFYRGDENNVLKRFYECAKKFDCNYILRITADCPFVSWEIIDDVISKGLKGNYNYTSNVVPATFPDGLDCEFFSMKELENAYHKAKTKFEHEHVTTFIIKKNLDCLGKIKNVKNLSKIRWTLDEYSDYKFFQNIINYSNLKYYTSWTNILKSFEILPNHFKSNQSIKRNAGSDMSETNKLWTRAKNIIAGGNHLLSKRPEMFSPNKWPAYFSKTSGIKVWDLDNNCYKDFCIMGVGTNSLGYSNPKIDTEVMKVVNSGNLSSLNAPEEIFLAEQLLSIHQWADMVRFARTGGEANSVAIRLARASTGRDKVAICGYHGWHDWYLATNLKNKNGLNNHLLSGLSTDGVPRNLKNSVFSFTYNNINELKNIIKEHSLAAVIMEVERSSKPKNNFLKEVRKLCDKNGIVLIFDECTTGFRETIGGLHLKYKINPDMCMFGKALGNGYAITAVLGKRDIMECAQDSFISSTFWTERIGVAAGLATLKEMQLIKSWEIITYHGNLLRKMISKKLRNNIKVDYLGLPALTVFTFKHSILNEIEYASIKTYITQEMLKRGYLASNLFYASIKHEENEISQFASNLTEIIEKLVFELHLGKNINDLLEGPVCHIGFQRLS